MIIDVMSDTKKEVPMRTSVPSIAHIPARTGSGRVRWTNLVARLGLMWQVYKERDQLKLLDDRTLADLGIDRDQVAREASRSPFDLPTSRL